MWRVRLDNSSGLSAGPESQSLVVGFDSHSGLYFSTVCYSTEEKTSFQNILSIIPVLAFIFKRIDAMEIIE